MKIANKIIGNIIGKPRVRGGRKDRDGDGVPNKKIVSLGILWDKI